MDIKRDSVGNPYIDVGEWTRITLVLPYQREESKDWAGCAVLRVQTYRELATASLHRGAEFPITNAGDILTLIQAISTLAKPYFTPVKIALPKKEEPA